MTEIVSFTSRAGHPVKGALALPAGAGQSLGVVVIQEWWGLNEQIKHTCQRLAEEGFVALAPDLYHGTIAKDATEAGRMMGALDWPKALDEIAGAVEHLRGHARVNGKVAVLGFCMGGALAFATACSVSGLAGVVPFYGVPAQADWSKVDAPILAHFAKHDEWATVGKGEAIQDELTRLGKRMDLEVYDAQHAFMNEKRPEVYSRENAQAAWRRTVEFLQSHA